MRALVLLSGGLDSTTCLAVAQAAGHEATALTFDYGQRHEVELAAARRVAASYGVEHIVQRLPLSFPGSALTDPSVDVPKDTDDLGIPPTYVPARNIIFLSIAAGWAEAGSFDLVYIGVSSVDYSGYPDCRPEFIRAMQTALDVGQSRAAQIIAPLLYLSKVDTLRLGRSLGVDYDMTHSCYDPVEDRPCGRCDSCRIRSDAFAAL